MLLYANEERERERDLLKAFLERIPYEMYL